MAATDSLHRDAQVNLLRGVAHDGHAVLVLAAATDHPPSSLIDRMKRELDLRDGLDPAWAAVPLALVQESGRPALVLADCGGEVLSRLTAPRAAPLGQSEISRRLRLAITIAGAIGGLHASGLIHKDIKPANILVDEESGTAHLIGFGVATTTPRERRRAESVLTIEGSFAYMPPEQTGRVNRSVDQRSDLYSLGVTLYEVFTGGLPFLAADPMEWIHCHVARMPHPPADRVPGLPDMVSQIIMKLLAKAAEDRYQTAAGLLADLDRCLTEWDETGRIDPFSLGQDDVSGALLVPEKLYGRDAETEMLLDAFRRVSETGGVELVLVSGYSGVGKSALVNQIHPSMVDRGGTFSSGKFDQHRRDVPYATFAQAFQHLVRQMVATSETEIRRWSEAILDAVGPNGSLIIDLIPQLELVIGPQAPVADLPPNEAMARFLSTFRRFVSALARPEQPLVLFLDDLQWMDSGSAKLLEHLLTHPDLRHLLLIGGYRDNEVAPSHLLMLSLDAIRKSGCPVSHVVLSPLCVEDLGQLVSDSLHCPPERCRDLVDLIHDKTAGNPFFAIQFLGALADEGLLTFDAGQRQWAWAMGRIRAKGFSENVVELMNAKMERLAPEDQAELRRVACIGNTASVTLLSAIYGRSPKDTVAALREAVHAGFLFVDGDRVQFAHDRIQEAAYHALPAEERSVVHLHVGRQMLACTEAASLDEAIFDVVHHLNLGGGLISESSERKRLCGLNAMAGRKAKASSANASARTYFRQARGLLAGDCWEAEHGTTFQIFLDLSECEYLMGNHAEADSLFGLLLEKARSVDQRSQVWRLRFRMFMVSGRFGEAVTIAVEALGSFGLVCPDTEDDTAAAVQNARDDLAILLGSRSIAQLVDLPECTDPSVKALIGVIADAIPAVYHVRPLLYPFLGLSAINLSLRHGVTAESSAAFSGYSVSLVGRFEDIQTGLEFSELALKLGERFDSRDLRGTLLFRHGYFVGPWSRPVEAIMPVLEDCFRTCLDTGNMIYAAYVAYASGWMLFEKGEPLETVLAHMRRYAPFARNNKIVFASEMLRLQELFIAGLQGQDAQDGSMGTASAEESYAALVGTAHGYGIAFYHVIRQITPYLMGRIDDAMRARDEMAALLPKISSSMIEASHHFYGALTILAHLKTANRSEWERLFPLLDEHRRKLRLWAENCPTNFAARSLLVEAELLRLIGRTDAAMRLFEDAIRAARQYGQLHCEAITNELAAALFQDRGLPSIAETYLRNARYCYLRWGAFAKVGQLDHLHPNLAEGIGGPDRSTTLFNGRPEGFDLMTVVKAQQAVSGEIVLGKLVEALLRIVVEHAGADRGLLILRRGDLFRIEAEAVVEDDGIQVEPGVGLPEADDLPLSVLHYVTRSRERVVLDDAATPNSFMTEGYAARSGVKSLLCLPVVTHGELSAVLYLENRLTTQAFTRSHMAVLDLLATQASISLENALLYAEMEERVADRTHDLGRSLDIVRSKSDQVRALLDNSGQGFLSFGADLVVQPEFSQACIRFFGGSPAGRRIDSVLIADDPYARDTVAACLTEALSETDPDRRDLYLSLLPEEVVIGGIVLKAEFRWLSGSIMVVLTDITEGKALEAQIAHERARLEMIVSAVTYGHDFFDVIDEFRAFIAAGPAAWAEGDGRELYRRVHTFKGTFNQLGFYNLAQALHGAETRVQQAGPDASRSAALVFDRDWNAVLDSDLVTVTDVLGDDFMRRRGVVTLSREQAKRFEQFARGLLDQAEIRAVLNEIANIRLISLREALEEFDKLIRQVSARLNKMVAPIQVVGNDVRIDPELMGPFLRSLGHVFRNAVDHGIESPDARLLAGKSETGAIQCRILRDDRELRIEISDDGGGIDVDALRSSAAETIGPVAADWSLNELVFGDGISSRHGVSEFSGRGVGLPAVRSSVETLGGRLWLDSVAGQGTTFGFAFPLPVVEGARP
jgi:predicted ATPase/GAF domain-containing protein/signal transduction histidine kinase/tRNA A-37 threonylcarbamoyl transferase component Bud32